MEEVLLHNIHVATIICQENALVSRYVSSHNMNFVKRGEEGEPASSGQR